jgi:DNA-binding response OmpR family regulator
LTRIAIVEDDYDLSRLIRDVLRESGHDVVSYFQPSPDTLESLKTYKPDLVILDLRLNSYVTGLELVSSLKEEPSLSGVPIVMCSADTEQLEEQRSWLESVGVEVLPKPFQIDELEGVVDDSLSIAASRND